jgi:hypothetical protein
MSNLAWTGVIAIALGLILIWQRVRVSRLQHAWDKRMSPRFAPYFRTSPRSYAAMGASFVILGTATVIYALLIKQ